MYVGRRGKIEAMEMVRDESPSSPWYDVRGRKVVDNISRPFDEGFGTDEEVPRSYQAPDPSPPPWRPSRRPWVKSTPLAVILAILVPGLGHVYLRRFVQGAAIFLIVAVLLFFFWLIVPAVIAAFVWAWQVYDAWRTSKEYNRRVVDTGGRPW